MSKISTLRSLVTFLEKWAPRELAESWDNVGLLVEPVTGGETPVTNVLLTNDLTTPVMQEALSLNVQLILAYHPLIFKGMTRITMDDWKGKIVGTCLQKGIALYSPHTSWDNSEGGISDWLLSPLIQQVQDKEVINRSGRFGKLTEPLQLKEIVQRYKVFSGQEKVRFTLGVDLTMESICSSVAVCAGSGSSVLAATVGKCDLWVTGEMSHHELLNAQQSKTSVLLLEHSNSERNFLKNFKQVLVTEFPNLGVTVSTVDSDPVKII